MDMQTSWYLEPGQTIENTTIGKRDLALHITGQAWQKVRTHLDRNRLIQDAIDREHARKLALKEGSEEMTSNWDNSVENIRKRKEEEREIRLTKKKDDRMQKFFEMRAEQNIVRQKYVEEARKNIYLSSGYPKNITSALIFSEVLYQRERQLELENVIQEHEEEEKAKYAKKVKAGAEQEKLENLEKEKIILQKKLEMKKNLLDEIQEKAEAAKSEKQNRIKEERENAVNAQKEINKIKDLEEEKVRQYREMVNNNLRNALKEKQRIQYETELQEQEYDQILDIHLKSKNKIVCLRKKREKEIQGALQGRTVAAAKPVIAAAKVKAENEERFLEKGKEELDKQEKEKLLAKAKTAKRLLQERLNDRQEFLKRDEKRKSEETVMSQWEMLNRFKTVDVLKQYELDKKKREWEKTLQYREDLFKQMAENEAVRKKTKEEQELLHENSKVKLAEEDNRFFDYAEEARDYARKKGRTTESIERVVQEYIKVNHLPRTNFHQCENYGPRIYKKK